MELRLADDFAGHPTSAGQDEVGIRISDRPGMVEAVIGYSVGNDPQSCWW